MENKKKQENKHKLNRAKEILVQISNSSTNLKFKHLANTDLNRAKTFRLENKNITKNKKKKFLKYKKGTIVFCDFGIGLGEEISLRHFAIVLDNKDNPYKGTLTVIPLSSKNRKGYINLGDNLINNIMREVTILVENNSIIKEGLSKAIEYPDKIHYPNNLYFRSYFDKLIERHITPRPSVVSVSDV